MLQAFDDGGDGGEPLNPSTDTKGGKNWRLGLGGGGGY